MTRFGTEYADHLQYPRNTFTYLLDKEKKVIFKDAPPEKIIPWLQKNVGW